MARSQQISMQCLCTRSLYDISYTSSLEEFSWQDLCKRPIGKIFAADLYAMSLYNISKRGVLARSLYKIFIRSLLARLKISVRDLKVRSLFKLLCTVSEKDRCSLHQVSVQDLYKRSPGKISVQDLYKGYVGKISVRGLLVRSLNKIFIRGPLARSLYKLPIRGLLARFLYEMSRLVRACAVEMHMGMSEDAFRAEIYRENARR